MKFPTLGRLGELNLGGHILFTHRIEVFTERSSENNVRLEKTPKLPGTCFETELPGISRHNEGEGG